MMWLSVDPGNSVGWALWNDEHLVDAGTSPSHDFVGELEGSLNPLAFFGTPKWSSLGRVVCEDWALYPWEIKNLSWDKCRTARLIGKIELLCDQHDIEFVLQPAAIKNSSKAGGAGDLFLRPLHENRHANDAIMHGFWYIQSQAQVPPQPRLNEAVGGEGST